jgi:hypothetical protein
MIRAISGSNTSSCRRDTNRFVNMPPRITPLVTTATTIASAIAHPNSAAVGRVSEDSGSGPSAYALVLSPVNDPIPIETSVPIPAASKPGISIDTELWATEPRCLDQDYRRDQRRSKDKCQRREAPLCRELGLLAGEIGRVHRARGELQRAHEIETDLHGELEKIRARINADRPDPATVELDAETEAARRAREPLGPVTRRGAGAHRRRRRRRGGQAADRSDSAAWTAATVTRAKGVTTG